VDLKQYDMRPQQRLLNVLHECEATCEFTEATLLLSGAALHRTEQIRLLRDCADMCSHTARKVARHSVFADSTVALCAQICEVCGANCLLHPDELSQRCGRICLHCAEECRRFSMAR